MPIARKVDDFGWAGQTRRPAHRLTALAATDENQRGGIGTALTVVTKARHYGRRRRPSLGRPRVYLAASLAQVDYVFQLTRRFLSALKRSIDTASGRWQQVWYGYAPYNPDMVQKCLDVFRAVNNFVHTGVDGHARHAARLRRPPARLCQSTCSGRARESLGPGAAAANGGR